MIAIVDYGAGNLANVQRAFDFLGAQTLVTGDPGAINDAERVVLPGVGAFGDAMRALRGRGLADAVCRAAREKPFLGICLGLQLLFEASEESPGVTGLGVFQGSVRRFSFPSEEAGALKVPHIGWNTLHLVRKDGIFSSVNEGDSVYFVHAYYVCPTQEIAAAKTDYGTEFVCAVEQGKLSAVQFHPEKSGGVGLKLLETFLRRGEA